MDAAASAGCKVFAAPGWLVRGQFEPQIVWRRGNGLLELTPRACMEAIDACREARDAFEFNPNETLLLERLMMKLPAAKS